MGVEQMVSILVYVPASLRKRIKVMAALEGESMAQLCTDALDFALTEFESKSAGARKSRQAN